MKKTKEKKKVIKVIEKTKSAAPPLCGQSTHIGGCNAGAIVSQL